MGNQSGNAYGLTALIPIRHGSVDNTSFEKRVRDRLQKWPLDEHSPMAKVPNTYLSRFYLLNDCFYEGKPAVEEHLANKYLVFSSNFYGELETYLQGMWNQISDEISELLEHCVSFDEVNSAVSFADYIKRCQVDNSLFFMGSTDQPLDEQLKGIYLKQAFSHFAYMSQPFQSQEELGARRLQQAYNRFVEEFQPENMDGPTWPVAATQVPADIEGRVKKIIDSVTEEIQ